MLLFLTRYSSTSLSFDAHSTVSHAPPLGQAARRDFADPDVPGPGTAGSCEALCGAPPRRRTWRGPGPRAVAQWLPPAGLLRG